MRSIIYLSGLIMFMWSCAPGKKDIPEFKLTNEVLNEVDDRIFGQFLEKPSWDGEIGPEAAYLPRQGTLQEGALPLLKEMNIPVLRFPGGTDVDHMDWRDMVNNVPGRSAERPVSIGQRGDTVTNYFGYDEALQLSEELGAEMILVVNFGQAYFGEKNIQEAAQDVAALVAYCNAEVGAELPDGMYDWPALRAENGRQEPYDVRYVQIANEPWVLDKRLKIKGDIEDSLRHRFFEIHKAYIKAIRDIDADVEIIIDGNCEELARHAKEELGNSVQYAACHVYYPWQVEHFEMDGEKVSPDTLPDESIWNTWVSFPQMDAAGNSIVDFVKYDNALSTGYPVAMTEWNWNGWWHADLIKKGVVNSKLAQGIGAAGFIQAFMREGEHIKIGCQSMLIGNSWDITAIRVSPTQAFPPHFYPTGKMTGFYAAYHGNERLKVMASALPSFEQPFKMNALEAKDKVNYIDAVVTRSEDRLYFHVINRSMKDDLEIRLDIAAFDTGSKATHRFVTGPVETETLEFIKEESREISVEGNLVNVVLPKRSASVVVFELN